ncbi:hypothetical protein [Peribacillus huizhouensis]|uniref:Redox-sensitive bicupin YhaK (Pirin superfamily) n=1 Tax=Peribacillus huizhouensis TaxID=1501239 RepID=A0ABR6CTM0_9BACI|nr:hypothetical protein [Peribacillus huizhouensis]MBA9028381.1 redox-sensitive bicupin YhaK (pirin superfamily) [Peribacillus huizhouensis]
MQKSLLMEDMAYNYGRHYHRKNLKWNLLINHLNPTIYQQLKSGATIKVLTGTVDGVHGLIESESPIVLASINFSKNTSIEIEVNESFELGLYGVLGRLIVDNKNIQTGELAVLSSGNKITIY